MNNSNIDKLIHILSEETDICIGKRLSVSGVGDIANFDKAIRYKLEYINLLKMFKGEGFTVADNKVSSTTDKPEVKVDKDVIVKGLANIVSCRIRSLNFNFINRQQTEKFRELADKWFEDFLNTSVNYRESLDNNIRKLDKQLDSALATCYSSSVV